MLRFRGDGETVLHWAASIETDLDVVEAPIEGGAEVDVEGGIICLGTPLLNALYFGFTKIGTLLLSKGAFVDNIIIAAGLGRIDLLKSWHRGNRQYVRDSTCVSANNRCQGDGFCTSAKQKRGRIVR